MDRTEEEKAIIKAAKEKALNLLSYSDKTEKGLRDKLAEHGFPPYAIDEAISYVRSFHYLDDKRFAEAFIRTQAEHGHSHTCSAETRLGATERTVVDAQA